jgi:hypothetical protein
MVSVVVDIVFKFLVTLIPEQSEDKNQICRVKNNPEVLCMSVIILND